MAAALLQHRRVERLREQHRALEVDAQGSLQLLGGEVLHPPGGGQAGVGDEDLGAGGGGRELLAGQFAGELFQRLLLAGAQQQGRAATGERAGDRPAEAPGGAGEECGAARKIHSKRQATSRAADRIPGCASEFQASVCVL
jgi:hypothetical protein